MLIVKDIKQLYKEEFLPARNSDWAKSYRNDVKWGQNVDEAEFRSNSFQKELWERAGVTGIGPGSSVTVTGAYTDTEIIEALWALKVWAAPADIRARGQHLDSEFSRILSIVSPRHNKRRPSARLARVFAILRPYDVVCLVDTWRTGRVRQWLELSHGGLGMIGQNVLIRHGIQEALGQKEILTRQ